MRLFFLHHLSGLFSKRTNIGSAFQKCQILISDLDSDGDQIDKQRRRPVEAGGRQKGHSEQRKCRTVHHDSARLSKI